MLALREQPVADGLKLVGVVEEGHMLTGTASGRLTLGKCCPKRARINTRMQT